MARETNIMITARDGLSAPMRTMQAATNTLITDINTLGRSLDDLNKTRFNLKNVDLTKAKQELSEAQKAFKKTEEGTDDYAAALDRLSQAQLNVDQITSEIRAVGAAATQTQRDISELEKAKVKLENRAGLGDASAAQLGMTEDRDLLSAIASAGAAKMVGDVLKNAFETASSSLLGDRAAQALGSVVDSAVSGAAIGTAIAPGLGTAVGALGGAALGGITAAINDFKMQDDTFKGVVQELYQAAADKIRETGLAGIELASMRERRFEEFATIYGDVGKAQDFLGNLQQMANQTPFEYDTLTALAKSLTPYFSNDELGDVMTTLGNTGATLGLEMSELDYIAGNLGYMRETDKLLLQQLKPLQNRGIPVFDYLAEGLGIEKDAVFEGITKNEISGSTAVDIILAFMSDQFEGGMEALSKTYSGRSATVEELWQNIGGAYGEAYTEHRMPSLEREQKWLENKGYAPTGGKFGGQMEEVDVIGGGGEGLKAWQSAMGAAQAEYDATQGEVYRSTMDAFMTGNLAGLESALGKTLSIEQATNLTAYNEQYQTLLARSEAGDTSAGAELTALMGVAESWATTLFEDTDIAGAMKDANIDMVTGIQDAVRTSETMVENIINMKDVLSQGMFQVGDSIVAAVNAIDLPVNFGQSEGVVSKKSTSPHGSFAVGLDRVPFDGFIAELHEGERVLTAQQARSMDSAESRGLISAPPLSFPHEYDDSTLDGDTAEPPLPSVSVHNEVYNRTSNSGGVTRNTGDVNISISGTFNVREDADIRRVAQELVQELKLQGMVT